jgi:drug/metabolite transporter (DMT)-like permease/shikimate kinase
VNDPSPAASAAAGDGRSHHVALAQALLVTFLWSTSWVLIKVGLNDLELRPLSFAGMRYVLAAALLLPLALPALARSDGSRLDRRLMARVVVLGVILYAVVQGAQYAALVHLPAVAVGLLLSTTPAIVAVASLRGAERPTFGQGLGIAGLVAGAALYFGPLDLGGLAIIGLAIAGVGVLANASAALLGRALVRDSIGQLGGALGLTAVSMAVGSVLLLGAGLLIEGPPPMTPQSLLIVGWLAVVNTALAFTLWNHTLRTLTAVESSVINNLMLVQIAILAWIFVDESLTGTEIAGLGIALGGIFLVQVARPAKDQQMAGPDETAGAALAAPPERVADRERRVLLMGMMGSGKTTIGRLLSEATGWPYHDNDELLARLFEATPREILGEHGEGDLRTMESQALALGLQQSPPCLVGIAAGTILDEGDRRKLRNGGVVLWLRGRPETLIERAAGSRHRAWLDTGGDTWIRTALEEREPLYLATAHVIVDVDDRTAAEVAEEALRQLRRMFGEL